VSSARDNSVNSPLLKPPAELRTKIWRYTLGTMTIFPSSIPRPLKYQENGSERLMYVNTDLQLSLTRTCRQIYSEARLIFYSDNTFCFHYPGVFNHFQDYLRKDQLEAIRYVQASTYFLGNFYDRISLDGFGYDYILKLSGENPVHGLHASRPGLCSVSPNLNALVVVYQDSCYYQIDHEVYYQLTERTEAMSLMLEAMGEMLDRAMALAKVNEKGVKIVRFQLFKKEGTQ
jgi:hypothetical protein